MMQIKRLKGLWPLAILLCVMPVLGQTPTMYNLDFKADVQSDGVPTNITPDASLPPAMQAIMRKRVAAWRYSMPRWQGEPVAATVYGQIVAETVPVAAGGFALRIQRVTHRNSHDMMNRERRTPPAYPPQFERLGVSRALIYSYKIGKDGRPEGIDLVLPANPDGVYRLLDALSRAAIAKWKLLPLKVKGEPVDCRVVTPIVFEIKGVPLKWKKSDGSSAAYYAAHADMCPDDPILLTEVAGSML